MDNLQAVVGLAMNDRVGAIDYLKRAPMRSTGGAADTGTEVHDLCEQMARGQRLGRVHPDLQPFLQGFQEFLDEFTPEFLFLEETVWSDTHGYAGSFDAIAIVGEDDPGAAVKGGVGDDPAEREVGAALVAGMPRDVETMRRIVEVVRAAHDEFRRGAALRSTAVSGEARRPL